MVTKKEVKTIDRLEIPGPGMVFPGKKVKHNTFGRGTIEELFEYPDGTNTIRVVFKKHGSKALVPEFTNLKPRVF